MARPCGPCQDKRRNELDRRLLEIEISGETIAGIARELGYSEDSLRRHKANHVITQLGDVRSLMIEAREAALAEIMEEVRAEEVEGIKDGLKDTFKADIANRLELCKDHFGQLKVLRERAAIALETAEGAEDVKTALLAIRELRELVRVWGELDGKISSQPQINLVLNPEWQEMRLTIITALRGYPEALEAVLRAIPSQPSEDRP